MTATRNGGKKLAAGFYMVCEGKDKATMKLPRGVVKFIKDHKPKIIEAGPEGNITITRIREVGKLGHLINAPKAST